MHTEVTFKNIGIIRSSYNDTDKIPIQPVFAEDSTGYIKILPEYVEGLKDLDMFSHLCLIYCFHEIKESSLTVTPFLSDTKRGIFATRAPSRPNPIGFSIVKLDRIIGNIIHVSGLDILDGTPLLDIKPYVGRFDHRSDVNDGWIAEVDEAEALSRGKREK